LLDPRERRVLRLIEQLVDGTPRRKLVVLSMHEWNISKRTAQVYVKEAEDALHAEACELPPLFALELSQMQRNKILERLLERANGSGENDVNDYCKLINMAIRILDSRDRTAERMLRGENGAKGLSPAALAKELRRQAGILRDRDDLLREQYKALQGGAGDDVEPPTDADHADDDEPCEDPEQDVVDYLDEVDPQPPSNDEDGECGQSDAELELYRQLESVPKDEWLEYAEQHYPAIKARMSPSAAAAAAAAGVVSDPGPAPCAASAPAANFEGRYHPNPSPTKEMLSKRERRRQEKKRLRQLRKRMRSRR
jgi:hypothetical protein